MGTKLTPPQVLEIKSALAEGVSNRALAKTYGVHETTISHIKRGFSGKRADPKTYQERIKKKVNVLANGCWIWTGSRMSSGYGVISYQGKQMGVHRVSLIVFKGVEFSEGDQACHTCDVRDCCNPDHLFVGSASENMQDAQKKGRLAQVGEAHYLSKLTPEKVQHVKARLKERDLGTYLTFEEIAKEVGVSKGAISAIHKGRTWKEC